MKTIVSVILLLSAFTTAQAQVYFSLVKTGPKVVVFGDKDHPTQIFIDEAAQGTIPPAGNWSHDFASYVRDVGQYVTISGRLCESSRQATITLWPPNWATDPRIVGGLAMNEAYLASNPTGSELKEHVETIKKAIRQQLGYKLMQKEIDAWFKRVEAVGLKIPGTTCEHPSIIKGYQVWIGVCNGSFCGERNAITLYVQGTPTTGYRFQVTQPTGVAWQ